MTGPPPAGPGGPARRQVVRAEGGFAYGVIGADLHVFGDGQPVYVLENWRAAPPADDAWLRELPSRMLSARHEIVPFTGRAADLAALHAWRLMDRRLAARWLHGPGGQGKTRLAARFARESLADGWKVVSAVHGPGSVLPPPGSQDLTTDGAAGLLLIVDYADQWPLPHLTWLFSNALLHRPGLPTRLLLLGRTADAWPAVRATLADLQAAAASHLLAALPDDDPDGPDDPDATAGRGARARMFRAARDSFAARHGLPTAAGIAPPMPLNCPDFGLTLTVHMAALVAVDAHRAGRRPPRDAAGLTTYLLDREQRQWARQWSRHAAVPSLATAPEATPPETMNQTVFAAALTGSVAPSVGVAALTSLGTDGPRPAERVLADHAAHYPPADPARPTVLEPLTPDRLAEDFVALTLPGHAADYPARDWAPAALHALLPYAPGTPTAPWTPRALTLVASAADRWPHVRTGYLDPLLREAPWLAVAAGGGALGAVAALADLDMEVLAAVAAHLPDRDTPDLAPAAAVLAVRLADHRLAATDDPAEQAAIYHHLGSSLSGAGRYAESLAATEQAGAGYEALARADPDRYELDLASALNNLSLCYSRERRTEEAVTAMERAVEIRRRRLTDPLDRHAAGLTVSLSNYSGLLKVVGRWLESLQADSEALVRNHRLATAHPNVYERDLAVTLLNHGSNLSDLREEAATDATRQAVTMLRRLAADDPAAYEGTLANGLANLASMLTDRGQSAEQVLASHLRSGGAPDPSLLPPPGWREEALEAIEQAVEIDRRRARANPAALETTLASSLRTSAAVRRACGMEAAALTDEREAAALSDRLGAAAGPRRAEHRETHGQQVTDVLIDVQLNLYRYLAAADLAAYGPRLAQLLNLPRLTAADSKRPCSSYDLAALREAAEVCAQLAALDPEPYEPDYAIALTRLADALWSEGEREESVPATERAADVTARLAAVEPAEYGPRLALVRENLVRRLAATGRRREARTLRRAYRRTPS